MWFAEKEKGKKYIMENNDKHICLPSKISKDQVQENGCKKHA